MDHILPFGEWYRAIRRSKHAIARAQRAYFRRMKKVK